MNTQGDPKHNHEVDTDLCKNGVGEEKKIGDRDMTSFTPTSHSPSSPALPQAVLQEVFLNDRLIINDVLQFALRTRDIPLHPTPTPIPVVPHLKKWNILGPKHEVSTRSTLLCFFCFPF